MKWPLHLTRLVWLVGLTVILMLITSGAAWADTCTSTSGGVWGGVSDSAMWVPAATDDIVVTNGHTITLGADQTTASLTIESGGALIGAAGNDLTVTGNWSNSGTFTHNGTNVTLAASSGTQTVSGSTTFEKLTLNASGATINFGSSIITVEGEFDHAAGTMEGGTSTFIFGDDATIGSGGNLIRFHHLTINGTNVTHARGGQMRISGNLTVEDGKSLTFSGSRSARFNGSALQTVTLNGSGTAHFNTLLVDSGSVVHLPAEADTQFTAQALTNSGVLQQTKTGVSGATAFLTLKNQSSATVYQGLDVTPGSGTPDITVSIAGNNSACNEFPNGGSYRDRCFRLNSSTPATSSSVTLHTTAGEDDIANDAFYQYVGGVWIKQADCSAGAGDPCSATVDLSAGDNYFLIGDANSAPTPVVLTDFRATATEAGIEVTWQTAAEIDFAGFYLWHADEPGDAFERIGPFIGAAGSPVVGADYRFLDGQNQTGNHIYRLEAVDLDNSSQFFLATASVSLAEPNAPNTRIFLPRIRR